MPGKLGQFDVTADGELIVSRARSLLRRLLGGGWPDPDAVVAALRQRHGS